MDYLLSLLAAPGTLNLLKIQDEREELIEQNTADPRVFPVRNKVPDFLASPKRGFTKIIGGALAETNFDDLDHYAKDAIFFDYSSAPEDPATLHENRRLHEMILRQLPQSPSVILDVGCGGAWFAREALPLGHTVVSFDASSKNASLAVSNYPSPRHYAVAGDALMLPFKSGAFDVVVSAEVIEHLPVVKTYLDNILRVLKPGGRAIISTPYNETIQHSLCIHCNRPTPLHAHLQSFREDSLNKYIAQRQDVRIQTKVFSSKVLLLLRTHVLLKHLPFKTWRFLDKLANKIVNKPSRLVYIIDKV